MRGLALTCALVAAAPLSAQIDAETWKQMDLEAQWLAYKRATASDVATIRHAWWQFFYDNESYDLLEWIAREPRTYTDVLDAWRTSCPRLTVWEDAVDRAFVTRKFQPDRQVMVEVTDEGFAFLRAHGRRAA